MANLRTCSKTSRRTAVGGGCRAPRNRATTVLAALRLRGIGLAFLTAVGCSGEAMTGFDGPAAEPWLWVRGPHIVDASGQPVRLVGMGLSPIHTEWSAGGFVDLHEVVRFYREAGCNSMRIAISRDHDYGGGVDRIRLLGFDRFIDEELAPQVAEVVGQGMYAIIDLHHYADEKGLPEMSAIEREAYLFDTVIPLWQAIARRYKDEPMVAIFELWNEPTWPGFETGDPAQVPLLRDWYRTVVRAIREIDTRHILMVSDHNAGWGRALEHMWIEASAELTSIDPLPSPQIVYSHHAAAISELRDENTYADDFSRRYDVPVAYGEVEVQPDVDENRLLARSLQETLLRRLIDRLRRNHLFQVWQGWRTGIHDWHDIWTPLTQEDSE